jgi:DNA-binding transcriptional LysR family regulator
MRSPARLRQILTLAEQGSFGRAAAALRLTQPALSKTINSVEKQLGVSLFDRHPRGVTLTAFGERVVNYAKGALHAQDDLLNDLALMGGGDVGRVDVALAAYPSVISGYPAAAYLRRQHPKVGIGLHVRGWRAATKAVANRDVDLAIAELALAVDDEALATEALVHHQARFFCRPEHPILQRKNIAIADLLEFPWATGRLPPRIATALPKSLGSAGYIDGATGEFVPAVELDVPIHLGELARGTDTLVIAGFGLVEEELRTGTLDVVPALTDIRAHYGFIWLRHRSLPPVTLAYMQAVRDEERRFAMREARLAAHR